MADIRNSRPPAPAWSPQARTTPARSEAVKAAQRAFFQAGLNGVEPVAAVQPRIAPTVEVQPNRPSAHAAQPAAKAGLAA